MPFSFIPLYSTPLLALTAERHFIRTRRLFSLSLSCLAYNDINTFSHYISLLALISCLFVIQLFCFVCAWICIGDKSVFNVFLLCVQTLVTLSVSRICSSHLNLTASVYFSCPRSDVEMNNFEFISLYLFSRK